MSLQWDVCFWYLGQSLSAVSQIQGIHSFTPNTKFAAFLGVHDENGPDCRGLACFLWFKNKFLPVLSVCTAVVDISIRSLRLQRLGNFQCMWSMLEYTDIWEKLSQTKSVSASIVALVKKRLKTQSVLSITNLKGNDSSAIFLIGL